MRTHVSTGDADPQSPLAPTRIARLNSPYRARDPKQDRVLVTRQDRVCPSKREPTRFDARAQICAKTAPIPNGAQNAGLHRVLTVHPQVPNPSTPRDVDA